MAGNTFGTMFSVTTWGESHGKALGAVIDGCPAGLFLCEEDIQRFLDRRKPGQSQYSTPRREADQVSILSGIFEGRTTGTPISLLIPNTSQHSADYRDIASYYRPGHADYSFDVKYGFRDYRGGGRSSGRETAGRVAAGAIASLILKELGITLLTYTRSIGPVFLSEQFVPSGCTLQDILTSPVCMPEPAASEQAERYLNDCMERKDSSGGTVECHVSGLPAGIGQPVFDKLDARLAQALMSIGAVKAMEVGDGCLVSSARGSANNDSFYMSGKAVCKKTNHAGGTLGGISDGSELVLKAHIKPTPSIFSEQETINQNHEDIRIRIKGRHDPVIVPRAVVVVEAMTAITIVDQLFQNMPSRMDQLKQFYKDQT